MSEYHKIQSLYLRDPITKHKTFLMGQYSIPEFEYLKDVQWEFSEKVDGTNVRVYWDGTKVTFEGRTKDAQMPTFLFQRLGEMFPMSKFYALFGDKPVTLYGEGYGAKIQKGGGDYLSDGQSFILFDIFIGDWFLPYTERFAIAESLGIKAVPTIGLGKLSDAVELCSKGFPSVLRTSAPEGLVIRPTVELRTRRGERIITKLKLKDFSVPEELRNGK